MRNLAMRSIAARSASVRASDSSRLHTYTRERDMIRKFIAITGVILAITTLPALADVKIGAVRSADLARSEEHTSELQSLMRISYAVFCLKKKKTVLNRDLELTQRTIHKKQQYSPSRNTTHLT